MRLRAEDFAGAAAVLAVRAKGGRGRVMQAFTTEECIKLAPRAKLIMERKAKERAERNKIASYFPDDGPLRREFYPKQVEFFAAGAKYKERMFMASNRAGKSEAGAYECVCHATGVYPAWWTGRRFSEPVEIWASGTTSETTRDIVQVKFLGPIGKEGTGMIPADSISKTVARRGGIADSIETIRVKHVSGADSVIGLKAYLQGRESFEGTGKHVVWLDEEPPEDVYTECLYRTATTKGIVMVTFTPLQGMSVVVKGFLEPEKPESRDYKWYIQAGWKDVPHIPEEEKRALLATTPPYQIKARTDGEPSLGAGAIYPIAESEISVDPFEKGIPAGWPRAFGMDVGWNRTAALWGARDPSTGIVYIYSEHYASHQEPALHALAIKSRGEWIPGVIDPACQGSNQIDGRTLLQMYRELGLSLTPAVNAVETGIAEVWQLLVSGKLKVFSNCQNFFREFRRYHRDDKGSGKVVKTDDHLMDTLRYLVVSGRERMTIEPSRENEWRPSVSGGSWAA